MERPCSPMTSIAYVLFLSFFFMKKYKIVVGRHFGKDVSIFNNGKLERTLLTSQFPTKVKVCSIDGASEVIAVAEYNVLTVWDLRVSEHQGKIASLTTVSVNVTVFLSQERDQVGVFMIARLPHGNLESI